MVGKARPKKPGNRPSPRAASRPLPKNAIHIGLAIAGFLLLTLYFGGMILEGSKPKAPDTTASHALSSMSQRWDREHGEMPLWTPAAFSGMPSYGSMVHTRENPLTAIIGTLSGGNLGIILLAFFGIAGVCTYALLIRYGRSPIAAFLAATVYVMTPYFPGLIAAGHNNKLWAAALIPPFLLVTDGLIRHRSLRAFAWFCLVAAWQLWVRHPQVTYYGMLLIGCIVVADIVVLEGNLITRLRRFGANALLIGGGLVVALGVVALPYLPVLEFTPHSVRGGEPSAASELIRDSGVEHDRPWEFATQWSMHPKELITYVVPSFYGLWNDPRFDRSTQLEAHTYWGYMPFTQSTHYLGLIPLLLAFLVRPNRHGIVWGCIAFSVLALLIGLGRWFPALYWPAYTFLPLFAKFRVPSMIYMILPLSVGIVAAWALDRLMAVPAEAPSASRRGSPPLLHPREERVALWIAAVMGVFAITILAFNGGWHWAVRPGESVYPQRTLAALTGLRGSLIVGDLLIALVLTALVAGGLWLVNRRRLRPELFGVVIVIACLADLWRLDAIFFDALPPTIAASPTTKPPEVDMIRQHAGSDTLFRIAPVTGRNAADRYALQATNEWGRWNLQSVSGYHAAKLRIYDDLTISHGLGEKHVLDMLNVRYFIGPAGIPDPDLVPLNRGLRVVYYNRSALPRAWWVDGVRSVANRRSALREVIDPAFDPAKEAIVIGEATLDVESKPSTPPEVVSWDYHDIVIETDADRPAFLVLSEVYYAEGWSATIDDEPAEIHQTDFVLRGLAVPEGHHTIRMTFSQSRYETARVSTWTLFPLVLIAIAYSEARAYMKRRSAGGSNSAPERDGETA